MPSSRTGTGGGTTPRAREDGLPVPGLSIEPEHEQEVAIATSVPLTKEAWQALREGEIAVLREGRLERRVLVS
jgi:predicted glutamine amidotransferase